MLVPQGGSSDRVLVDAVADVTATFEEVTSRSNVFVAWGI